jgi:hypothetical protein
MGAAVPYAVAAKFCYPERVAIALTGDAAMQMNGLNACITVAKYWKEWSDPRWITLVLNNRDLNMVTWEQRIMAGDIKFNDMNSAIYYATLPEALMVSLNEGVILRAMDRSAARRTGAATQPTHTWLGESLCLQLEPTMTEIFAAMNAREAMAEAQNRAWANLAILNEWKRLFPDQDPVQVHETLFGARPVDPAGGSYTWNEQWQTMQSANYGHPAEPKPGPTALDLIRGGTRQPGHHLREQRPARPR